ncbi:hypothetical protein IWZ00DRAFT_291973 [Phyllosticta capitalensis]|uniref:uncharacterized protein n=1 Tax=Phyllosticta capitalensis TaxID=121624 RepID=UPI0031325AC8
MTRWWMQLSRRPSRKQAVRPCAVLCSACQQCDSSDRAWHHLGVPRMCDAPTTHQAHGKLQRARRRRTTTEGNLLVDSPSLNPGSRDDKHDQSRTSWTANGVQGLRIGLDVLCLDLLLNEPLVLASCTWPTSGVDVGGGGGRGGLVVVPWSGPSGSQPTSPISSIHPAYST